MHLRILKLIRVNERLGLRLTHTLYNSSKICNSATNSVTAGMGFVASVKFIRYQSKLEKTIYYEVGDSCMCTVPMNILFTVHEYLD